jgi:putative membrane protein
MNRLGPGFINPITNKQDGEVNPSRLEPAIPEAPKMAGPILFESDQKSGSQRIQPDWKPDQISSMPRKQSPLFILASGLVTLVIGWTFIHIVDAAVDEFNYSRSLGLMALVLVAPGMALILVGSFSEWRSYRKLIQIQQIKIALLKDGQDVKLIRHKLKNWLASVEQSFPKARDAVSNLDACSSSSEIRATLEKYVLQDMRATAQAAGNRAALEASALIAITPSASAEGAIFAIRCIALIRQVALIYGINPGAAATIALLRSVASSAATVAAVDLLSQSVLDEVTHKVPVIKHLARAIPGAGLAAVRLSRLAQASADACSPCSSKYRS